jgi:hypothetical protein
MSSLVPCISRVMLDGSFGGKPTGLLDLDIAHCVADARLLPAPFATPCKIRRKPI